MTDIQHESVTWTSLRRSPDDPRPPAPLVTGIAFAAMLAWVGAAGMLDVAPAVGLGGVVVIAAVASWWLTAPSGLATAVIAFLVVDGFVDGQYGNLSWNGVGDAVLLITLALLCVGVPEARRELDPLRPRAGDRIKNP